MAQLGNYNRKTDQWIPGFGHPRSGDRSIDGSWIVFEVEAKSQKAAEAEVQRYVACKQAKFTGKYVKLNGGVALVGLGKPIMIPYSGE